MRPGARVDRVGGTHAGALVVWVRARASDGEANEAVQRSLAEAFHVSNRDVTCLRGFSSRRKFFEIAGDEQTLSTMLRELRI